MVYGEGMTHDRLVSTAEGGFRCFWPGDDAEYVRYHDEEWGRPVTDDQMLYEKLCLEGFQSGLSWLTILRKRENFREAFHGFDLDSVARFTDRDVARLMDNAGIVRHRGKIEATINNARCAISLIEETGAISPFFWSFAVDAPYGHNTDRVNADTMVATSSESVALSKALKKRGWKFVGPTTVYSFMQSMGFVNDHFENCMVREECERSRKQAVKSLRI